MTRREIAQREAAWRRRDLATSVLGHVAFFAALVFLAGWVAR
jgi:hypothetical protein